MTPQPTVLIIEDEPKIAQILVDFLAMDGFNTRVINDGALAVDAIREQQPDAVILDLMLPNKDGWSICTEVRQFSQVPILMLTARVDEVDRLIGLGIGADDYVCKPFSAREVVARIKVILRRAQPVTAPQGSALRYKHLEMDEAKFTCTLSGEALELTPVEFRLLATMIKRPGVVFSREQLMDCGYVDDRVVSARTIDSHMKNLRTKLNAGVIDDSLLHSVYGVGYKLQ